MATIWSTQIFPLDWRSSFNLYFWRLVHFKALVECLRVVELPLAPISLLLGAIRSIAQDTIFCYLPFLSAFASILGFSPLQIEARCLWFEIECQRDLSYIMQSSTILKKKHGARYGQIQSICLSPYILPNSEGSYKLLLQLLKFSLHKQIFGRQ